MLSLPLHPGPASPRLSPWFSLFWVRSLLFSGKAQLVLTLPIALALPEYSAVSPPRGLLLPHSSFQCLDQMSHYHRDLSGQPHTLLLNLFLSDPWVLYQGTHHSHLRPCTISDAQRRILLSLGCGSLLHPILSVLFTPLHPHPHPVVCPSTRAEPGLGLSCALPYSQHLEKHPAHKIRSVSTCQMNEWNEGGLGKGR